MGCFGCGKCEDGPTVKLHTGSVVCNTCPEWLLECEARYLLRLPLFERRQLLDDRLKRRGSEAVERLKQVMIFLHSQKVAPVD